MACSSSKARKCPNHLGNLISINEFLSEHPGDVMRLTVLTSNYRSPLTFNDDVDRSESKSIRPATFRPQTRPAERRTAHSEEVLESLAEQVEATQKGFNDSMDDDFNSAGALSATSLIWSGHD